MFKKTVLLLVPSLFALATFISLFSFWLGDLFSHFRMFWTVLSFIFLIGYVILFIKKVVFQKHIVLISIVFIVNLIGSFSFWKNLQTYNYLFFGNPSSVEHSEKVKQEIENDKTAKKLLLMNVLSSNRNYEEVKKLIKNVDADFVVILELNKNWENELKEVEQNYPHKFTEVREDNFGMGIYSKTSFTESDNIIDNISLKEIIKQREDKFKGLKSDIDFDINSIQAIEPSIFIKNKIGINIVVVHPMPPISVHAYRERNAYLNQKMIFVKQKTNQKLLLVGDFNCSPFSADYEKFLYSSNLVDSQQNFGFQPTWNSAFPFLMQTQLDHIWHSEYIEILHRQTLPIVGSDHKAVLVVFR